MEPAVGQFAHRSRRAALSSGNLATGAATVRRRTLAAKAVVARSIPEETPVTSAAECGNASFEQEPTVNRKIDPIDPGIIEQ